MLVTHWLTPWRLVNLIDATLACKDANSKLVEVVTVADVDAEDHVGNSLLIWELTFGHKAQLLFRLWAQGLVKILKLRFRCSVFLKQTNPIFWYLSRSGNHWFEMILFSWQIDSMTKRPVCERKAAATWRKFDRRRTRHLASSRSTPVWTIP